MRSEAEKRIREALADPALFDEGASASDTLNALADFIAACHPAAIRELLAERDALKLAVDAARILLAERDALKADAERLNGLLMLVSKKHPGESRYETAARYIREAERADDGSGDAAKGRA